MKKKKQKPVKKTNKLKRIYIDIYDFDLFYLVSDWAKCVEILKNKFNQHDLSDEQNGTGFAIPVIRADLGGAYFIWIDERICNKVKIHECFHATKYILNDYCGLELTDSSEEAYAYLLTYICGKVMGLNN